jgi:hypothetical protein
MKTARSACLCAVSVAASGRIALRLLRFARTAKT